MPSGSNVRVEVHGLKQLRRDLKAIDRKLPARLNRELRKAAEPVRAEAARLAPRSRSTVGGYRHLADTLKVGVRGSRIVIYSRKPGATVIHYGGRHPLFGNRDRWYSQQANPFIERAAARHASRIERAIADTVETVIRDAGFHTSTKGSSGA